MAEAFIIMQIGNTEMDSVCDDAIVPAISEAGFTPRRVDRHNAGDLLKSEIVQFIERSPIIIADVTNERPNCYLEIGYAMGLGKKTNLILTAREDHHHGSPGFKHGGPKIHFDLEGYDILFWKPDDLPAFRRELASRIKRRAAILAPATSSPAQQRVDSSAWTTELREHAVRGLHELDRAAYMEIIADLQPAGNWSQRELLDAMQASTISTFGWPIGIVLSNRDEFRPRPVPDGIVAEVAIADSPGVLDRTSYDYWKLFRDGRFYTLLSLFEDERAENIIFFDTRVNRVTEGLLLLARLYRRLGTTDTDTVNVTLRHVGLQDRTLGSADRMRLMSERGRSAANESETTISASLSDLETDLPRLVRELVAPLFMLFDFFEASDGVVDQIVNDFVAGKV